MLRRGRVDRDLRLRVLHPRPLRQRRRDAKRADVVAAARRRRLDQAVAALGLDGRGLRRQWVVLHVLARRRAHLLLTLLRQDGRGLLLLRRRRVLLKRVRLLLLEEGRPGAHGGALLLAAELREEG